MLPYAVQMYGSYSSLLGMNGIEHPHIHDEQTDLKFLQWPVLATEDHFQPSFAYSTNSCR
jgi:hypothetical protein